VHCQKRSDLLGKQALLELGQEVFSFSSCQAETLDPCRLFLLQDSNLLDHRLVLVVGMDDELQDQPHDRTPPVWVGVS